MAHNGASPESKKTKASSELTEFEALFPQLLEDLSKTTQAHPETADAMTWFKKMVEYNVPFGKKNRGMAVVKSYRHLVKNATDGNLKLARILGWCVELLQAYFLVADDVMDGSITRRGQPCWYKNEEVGLIAINDSFFLESSIYVLLKKYFKGKEYYIHLLELFLQVNVNTVTGQCLDIKTAPPEGKVDFTGFTMERYSAIVKWKTAYYSFYLPVALAMHMAGVSDDESHSNALAILLKMGHFFQVQDDYLDCFGEPEVIGKIGTDIEDNKCGWLVIKALELVNEKQKQILKDNYGRWDPECVKKVKALYNDLDMQGVYKEYEEKSYEEIISLIKKTSGSLPQQMFIDFANMIYKREK